MTLSAVKQLDHQDTAEVELRHTNIDNTSLLIHLKYTKYSFLFSTLIRGIEQTVVATSNPRVRPSSMTSDIGNVMQGLPGNKPRIYQRSYSIQ